MVYKSALRLNEVIDKTLAALSPGERESVYKGLIRGLGGSNVYFPCSKSLLLLERNIAIIGELPPAHAYCGSDRTRELAAKHNLSQGCIYRIRRDAEKTYAKIEELYDHGLISEAKHKQYIEVLQKKLLPSQIGKVLA